jgi:glycosyltransferase involved in cell wall biosynthesis
MSIELDLTVYLTLYKRPQHLRRQVDHIFAQTVQPKEIVIWSNGTPVPDKDYYLEKGIVLIESSKNFMYHSRFAAAQLARTEFIAVMDDDMFPAPAWLHTCYSHILIEDGIYGGRGVVLNDGRYMGRTDLFSNRYEDQGKSRAHVVMQSWFMRKKNLKYLWYEEPLRWDNGEDIQMCYMAWYYGGIRSFVPHTPRRDQRHTVDNKVNKDENATFRTQKDHYEKRDAMCRNYHRRMAWEKF